jgi:hypothetical protein
MHSLLGLVENSQRVDVHPYEEAQGYQQLLDVPGYDVAALGWDILLLTLHDTHLRCGCRDVKRSASASEAFGVITPIRAVHSTSLSKTNPGSSALNSSSEGRTSLYLLPE